ncbi:YkvA family protein [Aquirufa sp. ROCK2-A2]
MDKQESFLNKILSSSFFQKSLEQGEKVLKNNKLGLLNLIKESLIKVNQLATTHNISVVKLMNHYVYTFSLMIKAYVKGEYKKIPVKTLVKMAAVLFYFVSPFDFIPDFLPFIGFADDLALLLWVAKSIKTELDEFDKLIH